MNLSKYSIRDLLWATTLVGVAAGWFVDRVGYSQSNFRLTQQNAALRHTKGLLYEQLETLWKEKYNESFPFPIPNPTGERHSTHATHPTHTHHTTPP